MFVILSLCKKAKNPHKFRFQHSVIRILFVKDKNGVKTAFKAACALLCAGWLTHSCIDEQSSDIAMGVDKALEAKEHLMSEDDIEAIGAGDQGMMKEQLCRGKKSGEIKFDNRAPGGSI